MSLLDKLSYEEYEAARRFPAETCKALARISKCGDITPTDGRTHGEQLLHILDWRGYSERSYRGLLHRYNANCFPTKSQSGSKDSLDVIYIAGHGAEISGVRHVLGIDAPQDCLQLSCHTFTANQIICQLKKLNPQLCVLLIDACAKNVMRESKYLDEHQVEESTIDGYLVIGYSSSSGEPAYEELELSCNTDSATVATSLNTAQCEAAVPVSSQYANALAKHLCKRATVGHILRRVSEDLQSARRQQTPVIIESGVNKRFLFDPVTGDQDEFKDSMKSALRRIEFDKFKLLE